MSRTSILIAAALLAVPALAQTAGEVPERGIRMTEVTEAFGEPREKLPAVGEPPITRWRYPGFTVYFEHDRVLHSVVPPQP